MNLALLAGGLVTLIQPPASPPTAPVTPAPVLAPAPRTLRPLADLLNTPAARDAMARVAYAEAGNQGESGLAAVVYTIINRLEDGRWGATVEAVVDAPHQFEPVMRAGGAWRRLPPVTVAQEATVHTIVALALQGRLPDLTGGAQFFQNEKTVADRAAAGLVSPSLVGFGGAAPSAKIGDHTFYAGAGKPSPARDAKQSRSIRPTRSAAGGIFFGENHAQNQSDDPFTPAPTAH
jgi:spore germination cell wall hydrolase CwlJ-like protein